MLSAATAKSKLDFKQLKVAIVHDILLEYGGAERVLDSFLEIFPGAKLYTFFFNTRNKVINEKYKSYTPSSSFLQKFPSLTGLGSLFSLTKPLAMFYFYFLDLSSFDLVISSSSSYNSKIVRVGKKSLHICYLHTSPKYLYEESNQLAWIKKFPIKLFFFPLLQALIFIDKYAARNPHVLVVNSKEVQKRVNKYYRCKSIIIYPPVNLVGKKILKLRKEYYLCQSRLVKYKGLELAISTSNQYKFPLIIIGEGYLRNHLQNLAGNKVKFTGWIADNERTKIYSKVKALIYAAQDEDFGLVPIEAMSFGIPVIAYKSGGVVESVIDEKTGVIFKKYSEKALYNAIKKCERLKIKKTDCQNRAKQFAKSKFKNKFIRLLKKLLIKKYENFSNWS